MIVRLLVACVVFWTTMLSGCGNNVTPLTKYDNKNVKLNNKAVVIIGTTNATFLDLARYHDPKTVAAKSMAPKKKSTVKTASSSSVASADPNNQTYQNNRYDLRRLFNKNEQASVDNKTPETEVQADPEESFEYRIHKQNSFFSLYSYAKSTYVVEPGIYYIAFAYYDPSMDSNPNADTEFTRLPGINQHSVVQYGAFEAVAGEVVFLGDITFDWVDQYANKFVTITGNIQDVKNDLRAAGNNELATKVHQGRFYPKGAKIVRAEQGTKFILE